MSFYLNSLRIYDKTTISMRNEFIVFTLLYLAFLAALWYFGYTWGWWTLILFGPLLLIGWYDMMQSPHAIMRNFPVLGRGRYVMEEWRPKLYQYFIESDTDGRPISRIFRSVVYQRAKQELDTSPFGTQLDVYDEGYEWLNHAVAPLDVHTLNQDPRIKIGCEDCGQPYHASLLNVSAMSYGSLSKVAVEALNGGAAIGGFAHNTGEGGISPYHIKAGGDLIYQVGTGYFGCRKKDGSFCMDTFAERMASDQVRMAELKLSQGAKPGHGGILPGRKNTPEIAAIRGVQAGVDVLSPPFHTAFSTPIELLELLAGMREVSAGKPVGFKLCVGQKKDFLAICKAMVETGLKPDFICVDGGEGGTGAAPLEFTNSVGMPLRDGLAFVHDALTGFGLRQEIRIIAAGKIITGFHIFRALAIGADLCYSARAMMLALGCIQAMECNKNTCPTGVTTQNPELMRGLVVRDKAPRVANFHHDTIESFLELLAAAGLEDPSLIRREHVYRRVSMHESRRYDEFYPYLADGCLLEEKGVPATWLEDWRQAKAGRF